MESIPLLIEILEDDNDGDTSLSTGTGSVSSNSSASKSKFATHFVKLDEGNKFQCNYCRQSILKNNGGSTFNLGRHLKNKHPRVYEQIEKPSPSATPSKAQTIAQYFEAQQQDFTQHEFEKRIIEFIILTDQPFSIVESPAFQNLFMFSNNKAKMIGRNGVKSRIEAMFNVEKNRIQTITSEIETKVSFVLDVWTSDTHVPYQGIIARWINQSWELREEVLDLDILHGHHTGENLSISFVKVLEEFGLIPKILGITTDNASNCDTMFQELNAALNEKGVMFSEGTSRVRCLAHILNLACQDALTCLKAITSSEEEYTSMDSDDEDEEHASIHNASGMSTYTKLRTSVKKIWRSNNLRESFEKQCTLSKIKFKSLVSDVKTRWNSTFYMLRRAVKVQVALDNTLRNEKLNSLILDDSEWAKVGQIVEFLKPFQKDTIHLSSNTGPNMSVASAVYLHLYSHLEQITEENGYPEIIVTAATMACSKLNKYYPKTDGLAHVIGTVLDPRTKMSLYTANREHFPTQLIQQYRREIRKYWEEKYKPVVPDLTDPDAPVAKKKKTTPSEFLASQVGSTRKDKRDELQKYLDEPLESSNSEVDGNALAWWKLHQVTYPHLAKMARDFLAVSATGVPIERFFSAGPHLLTPKRRLMKEETVRICMCLKAWIRTRNEIEFNEFKTSILTRKILGD